jgi:hypothetical protein
MKTPPLNASLPNVDDGGTARLLPDEDFGASYVGAVLGNNTADEDGAKPQFPLRHSAPPKNSQAQAGSSPTAQAFVPAAEAVDDGETPAPLNREPCTSSGIPVSRLTYRRGCEGRRPPSRLRCFKWTHWRRRQNVNGR